MLLFRGKTIEKFHLKVKEKVTTIYVVSGGLRSRGFPGIWLEYDRPFKNWNLLEIGIILA